MSPSSFRRARPPGSAGCGPSTRSAGWRAAPPAPVPWLLGLFMRAVRVAAGAVLAPLDPLRMLPLVLVRKEVAALTLGALEGDLVSRHSVLSKRSDGRTVRRSGDSLTVRPSDRLTSEFS